ncbi:MAG: FAD-dependent oxidoreductase [Clostridia bacterium]|nr:FAD-dependent oxidoreductase [Clostridia bacterium]
MSSFWLEKYNINSFNNLNENLSTDVCIIGGGIFGITCAYYLTQKGINTVLLEKNKIAEKVSGHTNAKITSQHNLIYKYLIDSLGKNLAKQYLEANENGLNNIKNIIKNENIDCDFENQDAFVYTTDPNELEKIKLENEAVNSLGFHSEFTTSTDLPFKVLGAIKFPNQAQFNPIKYIDGLTQKIIKNKGKIFTNTLVTDIKKNINKYDVYTSNGKIVNTKYVILASHYPFVDKLGYYFLKMHQSTSYVIGVDIGDKFFNGMYINNSSPIYSYRFAKNGNKNILLVGGADHKTGSKIDLSKAYTILENEVRKYYPKCKVLYKWNTEDCISLDKIPYIGEFSNLMPNVYVGTGFNKWGMTSSNIAANIIVDKILGKENEYEEIFKSTRLHPIKNNEELGNMIKETANSLVINKFKVKELDLSKIKNDTGHVLEYNGEKLGIYKNQNGEIFAVKPICTHLGCLLSFNNLDKTWDCPCHGSRFDYTGKNLYNPGIKDLEKIKINKDGVF